MVYWWWYLCRAGGPPSSSLLFSLFFCLWFFFLFFSSSSSRRDVFFCLKIMFFTREGKTTHFQNVWGVLLLSPLSDVKTRRRQRRRLQQKRARARKRREDKSGLERRPRKELALDDEKNMTRKEKYSRWRRGSEAERRIVSEWRTKEWKKLCSMHTEIDGRRNERRERNDRADQRGESRTRSEIRGVYSRYWG